MPVVEFIATAPAGLQHLRRWRNFASAPAVTAEPAPVVEDIVPAPAVIATSAPVEEFVACFHVGRLVAVFWCKFCHVRTGSSSTCGMPHLEVVVTWRCQWGIVF